MRMLVSRQLNTEMNMMAERRERGGRERGRGGGREGEREICLYKAKQYINVLDL